MLLHAGADANVVNKVHNYTAPPSMSKLSSFQSLTRDILWLCCERNNLCILHVQFGNTALLISSCRISGNFRVEKFSCVKFSC